MARAANSFAMFLIDEEAETESEVLASVARREAEKAAVEAEKAAVEAEKAAIEKARVEAEAEDKWRRRRAEWLLSRQQNYGRGYGNGQGKSNQNGRDNKNVNGRNNDDNGSYRGQDGRSSNGSVQGQSRPSSASGRNSNQGAEWRPISGSVNGSASESTEPSKDAANDASEEKAEVVEESEEAKTARLKVEKEKIRKERKEAWEKERIRKEREAKWKAQREEEAIEAKQITLKKYEEAVLSEKRKALEAKAKKHEERKVTLDQDFETMRLIDRKEEDGLLVKLLEPETEKLKSKLKKKSDKVQKVNITEFLKEYVPKASKDELKMSNGRGNVAVQGRAGGHVGGERGRGVGGAAPNRQQNNSGNRQQFDKDGANRRQTTDRGSNGGNHGEYQRPRPSKTTLSVENLEQFPDLSLRP